MIKESCNTVIDTAMNNREDWACASCLSKQANFSKLTGQIESLQRSIDSLHAKFDAVSRRIENISQAIPLVQDGFSRGSKDVDLQRSVSWPPLNGESMEYVSVPSDQNGQKDAAYTRLAKAHAATTFKLRQAKSALEKWQSKARVHMNLQTNVVQTSNQRINSDQATNTIAPAISSSGLRNTQYRAASDEPPVEFISERAIHSGRLRKESLNSGLQEQHRVKQEPKDDSPITNKKISLSVGTIDLDDISDILATSQEPSIRSYLCVKTATL